MDDGTDCGIRDFFPQYQFGKRVERMPFTDKMKNVLLFVSELPEEQQNEIAATLASRIVAYDYACTMTFDEVMKLTELSIEKLSRSIDDLKR